MKTEGISACECTFHVLNTKVIKQNVVWRLLCVVDLRPLSISKTPNLSSHTRLIWTRYLIASWEIDSMSCLALDSGFQSYKVINSYAMDGTSYACGDDNRGKGLPTHLLECVEW